MHFTEFYSPDIPQGWLVTAAQGLTNPQLFITKFVRGNELSAKLLQSPY